MIPYGRQSIDQDDIDAVVEVLSSEFLTQGPAVERFESALGDRCKATHAVVVNSATSALHLAYLALGVGRGDVIWTSPITFVATANAALHCGADVDFVDIDPGSGNMDVDALERKLHESAAHGKIPRVVVPVHFSGLPCDMERIGKLANEYGFRVVEDASHAIGARYLDEPVGNCAWSDITVFSFHPVKIITSGEGGAALTQDAGLAQCMRELRSHGVTRDPQGMESAAEGGWYYEQRSLGFNYRLTDIQAALGLSQLNKLEEFILRRRELANNYDSRLSSVPVQLPQRRQYADSSWHLYVVHVPERKHVFDAMRAAGIGVNVHYIPVHLQPFYRAKGFRAGDFPEAEKFYAHALSIPLFSSMTESEQLAVVEALEESVSGGR